MSLLHSEGVEEVEVLEQEAAERFLAPLNGRLAFTLPFFLYYSARLKIHVGLGGCVGALVCIEDLYANKSPLILIELKLMRCRFHRDGGLRVVLDVNAGPIDLQSSTQQQPIPGISSSIDFSATRRSLAGRIGNKTGLKHITIRRA